MWTILDHDITAHLICIVHIPGTVEKLNIIILLALLLESARIYLRVLNGNYKNILYIILIILYFPCNIYIYYIVPL